MLPLCLAGHSISRRWAGGLALAWFWSVNRICNLKIKIRGAPSGGPSVLFVGNHVSYLDIPVLGQVMNAMFIAKSEVARWPVFGWGARLTNTVFIKRDPKQAMRQHAEIGARLGAGDRLILFPEGTSTDGKRVLPFKSALFSVAGKQENGVEPVVQPFSIAYTRYADGQPLDCGNQSLYAWHGDMELVPHLMSVFGLRGAIVEITFHKPVRASDFENRKALAQHCHSSVARGVSRAHSQRFHKPELVAGPPWSV